MSLFGLFKTATSKEKGPSKPLTLDLFSGPTCEECGDTFAIRFCPICNTNQCEECCKSIHLPKKRKTHEELFQKCITRRTETVQFTDKDKEIQIKPPTDEKCVLHPKESVTQYCKSCEKLTCPVCEKESHLRHDIVTNSQAIQEFSRFVLLDEKLVAKQLSDVKDAKQELTIHQTKLIDSYTETKESINEYFDALIRTAELKKSNLIKELDAMHEKNLKNILGLFDGYDHLVNISSELQNRDTITKAYDANRYSREILKFIPRVPSNTAIASSYSIKFEPKILKEITALKFDASERSFAFKERVVNVDVEKCSLAGDGIKNASLGKDSKFYIYLNDKDGKPARVNPESIFVNIVGKERISPAIKINRVGCYRVKYRPTFVGEIKISIEIGTQKINGSPFVVQIESTNAIELKSQYDFDSNGLFCYLGSLGRKKYENPAILGVCDVTSSSMSNFSTKIFTIVDKEPCNFYTVESDREPWLIISIAESGHAFQPNYYCIRNGSGLGDYALRNWKLEGANSKNGPWFLIKQHFDDTSIAPKKLAVAGWKVDALEFYTYFKISLTGPDASGETNLSLGGVEFYGLIKKTTVKTTK